MPAISYEYKTIPIPSYLKESNVFKNEHITLVYKDIKKTSPQKNPTNPINSINNSLVDLDLTGTPLEVDLCSDVTFIPDTKKGIQGNWTPEEASYRPLDLGIARNVLNSLLNDSMLKTSLTWPIFAVCNGLEDSKTVLMGVNGANHEDNGFGVVLVNILGCFSESHEFTSLEYMKKQHEVNVDSEIKTDYLISSKYFLYGYQLNDSNLNEDNGSISVDTTWSQLTLEVPQDSQMIMNVQAVIGHDLSPLQVLWEHLSLLRKYLTILSNAKLSNDEETIICEENYFNEMALNFNLYDVLYTKRMLKKKTSNELDIENLRPDHMLDLLWNILKSCRNLAGLRDAFNYFFEIAAECDSHNSIIGEQKSNVGAIIKGILNGKMAIPTINFAKALELLFELGVEKLKGDYVAILNGLHTGSQDLVETYFQTFYCEDPTKLNRRTSASAKLMSTDLPQNIQKLALLRQMHIAIELIFFVRKHCILSAGSMDFFCEEVITTYVTRKMRKIDLAAWLETRLCQFSFPLKTCDVHLIKKMKPVKWTVQMTSSARAKVTTVFHVSDFQIVPTTIYEGYDNLEEQDASCYITKLTQIENGVKIF